MEKKSLKCFLVALLLVNAFKRYSTVDGAISFKTVFYILFCMFCFERQYQA